MVAAEDSNWVTTLEATKTRRQGNKTMTTAEKKATYEMF